MSQTRRPLLLALGLPALLVAAQQQLLLRLPPRLERLEPAAASAGPAALQARFSRPMQRGAVAAASQLRPPLAHQWLGSGIALRLSLTAGQRLNGPLQLRLAGADLRGQALPASRWHWDPRGRVLAVVSVAGGEQLQLREHNGHWQAISPVWPEIPLLLPLGDGSAVASASRQPDGRLRLWRIPIRQANLTPLGRQAGRAPQAGQPQRLQPAPVLFAHLSSNRRGDLLVQSGGPEPGSSTARLLGRDGGNRTLPWPTSGPMQLLPEGGAVLVPDTEGLHLETLPPATPQRQTLPGSRDLISFCPQAGRAVLVRHWPDYRRSLELVEPGQPPRQLWLGADAVVATACDRGGERVWALLLEGFQQPTLKLVLFDRQGRVRSRSLLGGWELEPGTGLYWDPASGELLAALRRLRRGDQRPEPARAVLIDGTSLKLRPLPPPVRQAMWLPAG
jgi:hypothetical protein